MDRQVNGGIELEKLGFDGAITFGDFGLV